MTVDGRPILSSLGNIRSLRNLGRTAPQGRSIKNAPKDWAHHNFQLSTFNFQFVSRSGNVFADLVYEGLARGKFALVAQELNKFNSNSLTIDVGIETYDMHLHTTAAALHNRRTETDVYNGGVAHPANGGSAGINAVGHATEVAILGRKIGRREPYAVT